MKTKIEIAKKQIQQNNDNNKLTRGRKMKYFSIILTVMVTALIGRNTEPQTGWFYDQSTQQAFYMLEGVTIDGEVVVGDGTGEGDGGCELLGTCDVIGAFRRGVCDDPGYQNSQQLCELFSVWNTDEEICIGWRYADSDGYTTVALMGKEGAEGTNTFTYANTGESAYLKVYDSSNGSILDLSPSAELTGWELNSTETIVGTSTANNTFGCTDASACNYNADATADDGNCASNDCAGECGGSAELDDCGDCDGDNAADLGCGCDQPGPSGCDNACGSTLENDACGVCDGDDSSCTGCTNSDADNYDAGNTIDDESCAFTVPPATNLVAQAAPVKVYLAWDAPADNFSSNAGYTYDIYKDGAFEKTTSQLSTSVSGLTAGVEYCFTVNAVHNAYGAGPNSNSACAIPSEASGDPTWRLQVKAEIDSYDQFEFSGNEDWLLRDNENYLGVAEDGSWGYDPIHDVPEAPQGPGNYIKLFFDHPEWVDGSEGSSWVTHFTEDIVLDDHDFFSTNLTQWNVRVQSDVPGSTVIRFNVETGQVPANYEMYVELDGNYTRIEHDGETAIGFYMDGSGQQDLAVFIGNIAPQSPDNMTATGNYASISLNWDEDSSDLNDIGNRYPATSYNVYRDDQPADPNSNNGAPGNGPDGCGGLLTGDSGQSESDYEDNADIYDDYPGEGLLQESTYSYTVTGSNDAGESSEGHTVRLSGGADTWNDGRDSRDTATTGENADPVSVPDYMESSNGTNLEPGHYEIPHNNDPDANPILIKIGAWGTFDPDFPDDDTYLFEFTWTQNPDNPDDLSNIVGDETPEVSFSVANAHEDGSGGHNVAKSYTWNLLAESKHPVKVSGECGVWTTEMHLHDDDQDITVTIEPEPNQNPIAADGRNLHRGGDGLSVITSDDYDSPSQSGSNDFNDYDAAEGVWYEPHDNSGDDNQADLWFTATDSGDDDGMCDGTETGCPDGYLEDCSGDGDCAPAEWVGDGVCDGVDQAWGVDLSCFPGEEADCSGGACPTGYVPDCSQDGDCWPADWVGDDWGICDDGTCMGYFDEITPGCADLTCHEDDDGNPDGGNCEGPPPTCADLGGVDDCSGDGDCCSESWIGDGFTDCEDQAFGCDLTCYDNDGGDCDETADDGGGEPEGCGDGYWDCGDGQCIPNGYVCDGSTEFCNASWGGYRCSRLYDFF